MPPVAGAGKRGGARVIYHWRPDAALCYLVLAYPKNVMDTLTDKQLAQLTQVMREETGNG